MEIMERVAAAHTFWQGRRVLITGGDGFVGMWLGYTLGSLGAQVALLGAKEFLPEMDPAMQGALALCPYFRADVRDRTHVEELIKKNRIQTLFHLAAKAIVGDALEDPVDALDINVRGTWTILDACRKIDKAIDIVVASSDKAYGTHAILPYKEDFSLQGRNPYDCSKSCADLIAQMYAETYQLRVGVTRCANIYGGGDLHFSRLVPDTIRALYYGRRPQIRSDGLFRRDYVYVKDVVAGYIAIAEALGRGDIRGEVFNFGTNTSYPAIEVVKKITALMGSSFEAEILATAQYEIRDQYLDAGKARSILGWEPRFDLDSGLKETIAWYQDFFRRQDGLSA